MHPILRNILAVIVGAFIGGALNGYLISISGSVIPLPEGVDPNNLEDLQTKMKDFPLKNFIMPFLAHALGVLVGAFITVKIAASSHMRLAMIIGFFFLVGGVAAAYMIKPPMWYNIVDLVFAYIPMAYLGALLAGVRGKANEA